MLAHKNTAFILEKFPIKIDMIRDDYEQVTFKMSSCCNIYSVVSCENGNSSIRVFERENPKNHFAEIIPYDYIDCNLEDKKEIENLNKLIQIYRNALMKISNNKEDKEDFINYLNVYKNDLLSSRLNIKNCLMIDLDYQTEAKQYIFSENLIFPLKKQTCNDFSFSVPNNFNFEMVGC